LPKEPLFWLGDRFYAVDYYLKKYTADTGTAFESKCPSCNNTRLITYRGYDGKDYEAECPLCKGGIGKGYGNRIEIKNWQVREYIVHKISAQGPETVSAYKEDAVMDRIHLTAFTKIGRCIDDYLEMSVPDVDSLVDVDLGSINISRISEHKTVSHYVFRKKKDAEAFCRMIKDYDRKRLEEFNKTYGTSYEYPY
jgi:hypothetical protein